MQKDLPAQGRKHNQLENSEFELSGVDCTYLKWVFAVKIQIGSYEHRCQGLHIYIPKHGEALSTDR